MSRTIKFRAWDDVRKKMFSANEMGDDELSLHPDGKGFFNPNDVSPKLSQYYPHIIPLQYTGLKDRNGKEIYEGDIVKIEKLEYPGQSKEKIVGEYISEITFHSGCFLWFDGYSSWTPCQSCFRTEIIGNIHENPELLKAQ